jgi:glycosyltransferase involved in cell wall biosynthesis
MKVLHVETGRNFYGGALQVRYLLEGLHGKGVKNLLACPTGSEIGRACQDFATVLEVPMAGEIDGRFFFHLYYFIRRCKPDLVHIHSRRGADFWGPLATMAAGGRAVLTRRVDNPEPRWWARLKYRPYEQVVTISEGIRQVLLNEGVTERKLQCIHSAIDVQRYRIEGNREWFQKEFGLAPTCQTVGVIAQLIERKGHRFLIEAMPAILQKCPETHFLFFGKGSCEEKLRCFCDELGVADKVTFAGFRGDLPEILPCLDLVAHPALMEGLGVSLLQAAAAGVPIVGCRTGGIPEIVIDGENGYLVPPGSSEVLVQPIVELLSDSEKRKKMSLRGQMIVQERFLIEAMVNGNLALYHQVLRNRGTLKSLKSAKNQN